MMEIFIELFLSDIMGQSSYLLSKTTRKALTALSMPTQKYLGTVFGASLNLLKWRQRLVRLTLVAGWITLTPTGVANVWPSTAPIVVHGSLSLRYVATGKVRKIGGLHVGIVQIQQAFEDIPVAVLLCRRRMVRYKLKDVVSEVMYLWLFLHPVPHARAQIPVDNRLSRVICLSLLYVCLGSNKHIIIPNMVCDRVKAVYAMLCLDKRQQVEMVALRVYQIPNSTFGINCMVPTESDPAAETQHAGRPMTSKMGQILLAWKNMVKQAQVQMNLNVINVISLKMSCA